MKVTAMVHSKEKREEVELLDSCYDRLDGTHYIVRTNDGVKCTAIFNWFNFQFYVDDKYGIIKE